MFQTPPIENLLLASAPQAAVFVPGQPYGPVPPEWQNVYEVGLQQQITKHIRLDLTRYVKNARNFIDDEQFLETGVVFPLTIARGDVRGLEARLDVRAYDGLGGYLSYANSKAIGTTPITGGLPIGSGGTTYAESEVSRGSGRAQRRPVWSNLRPQVGSLGDVYRTV